MLILALATWVGFAGPALQVPWTCGVSKPCTQAHNGFSHSGTSEFAWDFDVNFGEEVWAASEGVVSYIRMDSETGGCDASYGNDANYVVVDHPDGTAIVYMHLLANSTPLEVGDAVRPGMLVARVGLTGYVCGDHLHLQVMEQCGSPYCQSLPATFVDYGDPAEGDAILSTNCPSCTLDLDGTQTTISELEPGCFVRETSSWWSAMSGDDDHHFYTMATDAPEAASTGTWTFGVTVPGDYRVEVFVPDEDADATSATYQVHHEAGVAMVLVDQATAKGWQDLGVFGFSGTEGEGIVLGDNTGDAAALEVRVGFDAMRLSFVPSAGESSSSAGDDGSGGDTSAADPGSASGSASDTGGTSAGGIDGDTSGAPGSDALPDAFGEGGDAGGCGCSTRDAPAHAWLAVLLLLRRRRRSA